MNHAGRLPPTSGTGFVPRVTRIRNGAHKLRVYSLKQSARSTSVAEVSYLYPTD
jgi:hypothetical protein